MAAVAAVAAVAAAAAADVLQTTLVCQSRKRALTVSIHLRSCFRDVHLTCNGDVSRTFFFLTCVMHTSFRMMYDKYNILR